MSDEKPSDFEQEKTCDNEDECDSEQVGQSNEAREAGEKIRRDQPRRRQFQRYLRNICSGDFHWWFPYIIGRKS
jgi:hypothetical protein